MSALSSPIYGVDDIAAVMDMGAVMEAVRQSLIAHAQGQVICPPPGQLAFDKPRGDCHIKYGYSRQGQHFVVKVATGFYDNPALGKPVNNGMLLLFDAATGEPVAIFQDEGWLTSWRTAAAGALAASLRFPGGCRRLGIIGTGHQAQLQAVWASRALGAASILIWGRSPDKAQDLARFLRVKGIEAECVGDIPSLMTRCEAAILCTSSQQPLLTSTDALTGLHVVSLGADGSEKSEIAPEVFARATRIYTDDPDQCIAHGDFGNAVRQGHVAEDGSIPIGHALRESTRHPFGQDDFTLVTLTGLAAQDLAIASFMFERLKNRPARSRAIHAGDPAIVGL